MHRRKFLELATISSPIIAGCGSIPEQSGGSPRTETVTATILTPSAIPTESNSTKASTRTSASIQVVDVSTSSNSVNQFERFLVEVKIENTGDLNGSVTVELIVDEDRHDAITQTIPGNSSSLISFRINLATPGDHLLTVAGKSLSIEVRETVLSIEAAELGYWERLLFTCLQGIANRERPQIYVRFTEADDEWASWYREEYDLNLVSVADPYRLLRDGPWRIEGYVKADVLEPDTANLAATYAATENFLPVTERILQKQDVPNLPVKRDLRGKFAGESKAGIYRWALNDQWEAANHGVVANLPTPGNIINLDIAEYTDSTDTVYLRFEDNIKKDGFGASLGALAVLRDGTEVVRITPGTVAETSYIVENEGAWLSPNQRRIADMDQYWIYELEGVGGADSLRLDIGNEYQVSIARAPDGPYETIAKSSTRGTGFTQNKIRDYVVSQGGFFFELASDPEHPEERAVKDRVLERMKPLGQVFGFIDRFPEGSERHHVGHLSEHNQLNMVSYHDTSNFSVHHQIEVEPPTQPNLVSSDSVSVNEEKVYVTFSLSDGDALWMHSSFHRNNWLSERRGEIPFGWEIQPMLTDLAPGMVDYYFKTATSNDAFVASGSGVGSQFPNRMSNSQLRAYLTESKPHLTDVDYRTLWVRSDAPDGTSDATAQLYADLLGDQLVGVFERYTDRGGTDRLLDGLVWLPTELPNASNDPGGRQQNATDLASSLEAIANEISSRPLFVPIHILITHPASVPEEERWGLDTAIEVVEQLDSEEFEVVHPEEFFIAYATSKS